MLVPPVDDALHFIDVRNVAEWSVRLAEAQTTRIFNAKGPLRLCFGHVRIPKRREGADLWI